MIFQIIARRMTSNAYIFDAARLVYISTLTRAFMAYFFCTCDDIFIAQVTQKVNYFWQRYWRLEVRLRGWIRRINTDARLISQDFRYILLGAILFPYRETASARVYFGEEANRASKRLHDITAALLLRISMAAEITQLEIHTLSFYWKRRRQPYV